MPKTTKPPAAKRARKAVDKVVASAPSALLDFGAPMVDTLSVQQRAALDAVQSGRNVFLTGRGGCGKSRTLEALIAAMTAAGTAFAVTASTGIAAVPLGGQTLHSFVCLQPNGSVASAIKSAKYARARICAPSVLIIDEVSMLSAETFSAALDVLAAIRGKKGLPVFVLAGDFLQLGCVDGTLLLDSPVWKRLNCVDVVLTDNWRQKDDVKFLDMLDRARFGSLSPEDIRMLTERVGVKLSVNGVLPTFLTSFRRSADEVNRARLDSLPGPAVSMQSQMYVGVRSADSGSWARHKDCVPLRRGVPNDLTASYFDALTGVQLSLPPSMGSDMIDFLRVCAKVAKDSNMDTSLSLKVGAQVMFTNSVEGLGVVNGSRGVVTAMAADAVDVRLVSGEVVHVVPFMARTSFKSDTVVVFQQLPLKLAWALTIHKSQGMSLDCCIIDIGPGVFAKGQAYVALSRMRSLAGMSLERFDPGAIMADLAIVAWYRARQAPAVHSSCAAAAEEVV